ncbi:MAG TPA: hypothetical protein VLK25_10540 [Allosphingosinicella sp.]|nr:hypothetical protein [Allosphingosinicella sp.]
MKARLLGLALLGIAGGGLASVLTGGASPLALLLALLAVPSAVVGLPLLALGSKLFAISAGTEPRSRRDGRH